MVVKKRESALPLSPRNLRPYADKLRFLHERSAWPFVHAVLPLALYATLRNAVLALLLIYVWETLETLLSLFLRSFTENKTDSLLGDPLVGALAIATLYTLDSAFGWQSAVLATTSLAARLGAFAVLGAVSALGFAFRPRASNLSWSLVWVVPLISALYAATLLVFYNRVLFRARTDAESDAGTSVVVWLLLVFAYATAATLSPPTTRLLSSTFLRVLAAELLLLAGALLALILTR